MEVGDLVWTPHPFRIEDETDIGVVVAVWYVPQAGKDYLLIHWNQAGEIGEHWEDELEIYIKQFDIPSPTG
jgi:hypothetical protein